MPNSKYMSKIVCEPVWILNIICIDIKIVKVYQTNRKEEI